MIRTARNDDLNRIAEIEVFNYRLKFYPIFLDDGFYFGELQVPNVARRYADSLEDLWVYDDGVVKGFILVQDGEVKKLFVEPILQGQAHESHGGHRLHRGPRFLEGCASQERKEAQDRFELLFYTSMIAPI